MSVYVMKASVSRLVLCCAILHKGAGLRVNKAVGFTGDVAEGPTKDVYAVTAACGTYCMRAEWLAVTFFAQAKLEYTFGGKKPTLHIFGDTDCITMFQGWSKSEPALFEAGHLLLTDMAHLDVSSSAANMMKPCNTLRIFLPRLLPKLHKFMYIDSDAIVVNSLRPLFRAPMSVYMMGEDGGMMYPTWKSADNCPTWRNGALVMEPPCHPFEHGLNDGVYLIDLDKWRALNLDAFFDHWASQNLDGNAHLTFAEQDMFNMLSVQHPEYLTTLPCEANSLPYNRWMCYFGNGSHSGWKGKAFELRRNRRQPIVIHSKFGRDMKAQQWRFLHSEVMRMARQLGQWRGPPSPYWGKSLCGLVKCGNMMDEHMYRDECAGTCNEDEFGKTSRCSGCTPPVRRFVPEDHSIVSEWNQFDANTSEAARGLLDLELEAEAAF